MNEHSHPYLPVRWDSTSPVTGPTAAAHLELPPLDDRPAEPAGVVLLAAVMAQLIRYAGPGEIQIRVGCLAPAGRAGPAPATVPLRVDSTALPGGAGGWPAIGSCLRLAATALEATALAATPLDRDFRVVIGPDHLTTPIEYLFTVTGRGRRSLTVTAPRTPRDPAALDRVAAHYAAFLATLTNSPGTPVADVRYATDAELAVLASLNDTSVPVPPARYLHQLVELAATRDPEALAIVQGEVRLTYRELDRLADARADLVFEAGARPGDRVAILAARSISFVVAALGVLKAGAAYVPLDPSQPIDRLKRLLWLGDAKILLVAPDDKATAARLTRGWVPLPPITDPPPSGYGRRISGASAGAGTELAYMIFTSGSTGEPKGVLLDHAGRTNMIADLNRRFALSRNDRALVVSSPSFDMSVYDIFGTLAAGATVVLPDRGREYDVPHWIQLVQRERVTVWHSVPSALTLLLNLWPDRAGPEPRSALRLFLLGGDWIPVTQPKRVHRAFPNAEFYSLGGATEVSVDSVIHKVEPGEKAEQSIPYGRPLGNQTARVIDGYGRQACLDQAGELVLGGAGVGWGYYGHPGFTAERFVPDPFTETPGGRMYRTGDQALVGADGRIRLLGRLDHQVKVGGVRIELGEVQTVIEAHRRVAEAAVVPVRGAAGAAVSLVAFVVPAIPGAGLAAELMSGLERQLHPAMLPERIEVLERLPMNANGKLDRRRLGEMAAQPLPTATPTAGQPSATGDIFTTIAESWTRVLGLEQPPTPDANFLTLGGASLAATQVVALLNHELHADLTVRDMLTARTLAEFAALAQARASRGRRTSISRIRPTPPTMSASGERLTR